MNIDPTSSKPVESSQTTKKAFIKSSFSLLLLGFGTVAAGAYSLHSILKRKTSIAFNFKPVGVISAIGLVCVGNAIFSVRQIMNAFKAKEKELEDLNKKNKKLNKKLEKLSENVIKLNAYVASSEQTLKQVNDTLCNSDAAGAYSLHSILKRKTSIAFNFKPVGVISAIGLVCVASEQTLKQVNDTLCNSEQRLEQENDTLCNSVQTLKQANDRFCNSRESLKQLNDKLCNAKKMVLEIQNKTPQEIVSKTSGLSTKTLEENSKLKNHSLEEIDQEANSKIDLSAGWIFSPSLPARREEENNELTALFQSMCEIAESNPNSNPEDLSKILSDSFIFVNKSVPHLDEIDNEKGYLEKTFFKFCKLIKNEGFAAFLEFGKTLLSGGMTLANTITYLTGIADRGFMANAPDFKKKQISELLKNLKNRVTEDLKKMDTRFSENNPRGSVVEYLKNQTARTPKYDDLVEILSPLFNQDFNDDTVLENAPQIRYELLMGLEKWINNPAYNYEADMKIFLNRSIEAHPHIAVLHLIAKHMTESPVWDLATEVLNEKINHKNNSISLKKALEEDVTTISKKQPNGMDKMAVNCEKLAMQNGNGQATNYRYNYSSLLGSFQLGEQRLNWLRMGTPTIDEGGTSEPSKLTALYTLFLDYCAANGKKVFFGGLQKGPSINEEGNMSGYEAGDYEINRTAAFIEAKKNGRWNEVFSFINLSLDQIEKDLVLNLVKPKELNKASPKSVPMNTFTMHLKKLMLNNELGFYGLKEREEIVNSVMTKVEKAFFKEGQDLSNEQRWSFLILSYGLIELEINEKEKMDYFHTNCKDGIDRAAVVAAAIMMILQFSNQCDGETSVRSKDIEQVRTLFSHPALLVKGQAVIASRAPMVYCVANQLEWASKEANKNERLEILGNLAKGQFTPFTV